MVAIEDVFYAVNAKSALKLGQVRGVAMLAASSCGLQVAEYSPLTIKSAVCGYGRAEKSQVQHMVTKLLNMAEPPESRRCCRRARHRHLSSTYMDHIAAPAARKSGLLSRLIPTRASYFPLQCLPEDANFVRTRQIQNSVPRDPRHSCRCLCLFPNAYTRLRILTARPFPR